jgi:hypothetical protein
VSRYKGGTLIDEEVRDLDTHHRRVADPDGYRPAMCPRCAHAVLHVHSYRERRPRRELGLPAEIRIVQYLCADEDCGAIWRVLPIFLARHLWWAWKTVERAVLPSTRSSRVASSVPEQTRRRWRARLAASARILLALFAARGDDDVQRVAANVSADATRAVLVQAFAGSSHIADGEQLASVAALSHRLERGVRLM